MGGSIDEESIRVVFDALVVTTEIKPPVVCFVDLLCFSAARFCTGSRAVIAAG